MVATHARTRHGLSALLLTALLVVLGGTVASPARGAPPARLVGQTPHEVWMLDQGTDRIHVYDSRGYESVAVIDVSPAALQSAGFPSAPTGAATVPHMIDFDSQHRYAFVASTAGAVTLVIDADAKQVVEVLPTGGGSHMAAVTPDDRAVWVAVIGAARMVEIPLDLDVPSPTFSIGRTVVVADQLAPFAQENGWVFPTNPQPVCHQFTPDSREAWVTLGPEWNRGGLFVLDVESAQITAAFDPSVVRSTCGVAVNREGTRVVANWSGTVLGPGQDTDGEWYVFNAKNKKLLRTESARGHDAHGVRFTPDGRQLWAVNRITDNALIVSGHSFRFQHDVPAIGHTPDILEFSPDGDVVYITQRGPAPRSGGVHAAAGIRPGIAVVDTSSRQTQLVLEPPLVLNAAGVQANDIHGVGVRPLAAPSRPGRGR